MSRWQEFSSKNYAIKTSVSQSSAFIHTKVLLCQRLFSYTTRTHAIRVEASIFCSVMEIIALSSLVDALLAGLLWYILYQRRKKETTTSLLHTLQNYLLFFCGALFLT